MPGRVLVVTYYFPPVGGVGVQRTLKNVTYLPRWGWEPVVVAPRDPAYPLRDPSLLASVPPGVDVHRSLSLEPSRVQLIGSRLLRHGRRRATGAAGDGSASGAATGTAASLRAGFVRRTLRRGVSAWSRFWGGALFPDEAIVWVPFGVRSGRRVHRAAPVDVLFSSAPPFSVHIAAGRLKQATGLPWVADFRDPWVGNPFAAPVSERRAARESATERWIVEHADRVVVASGEMRARFAERYQELASRFVYIPNGYDRADAAGIIPVNGPEGRFTILYAGSLYRPGELAAFLGGTQLLLGRRPDLRPRLRVQFVGRANAENRATAARFTGEGGIGDVVSFEDFVPRPQALARIAGADALLQLMTAAPGTSMFVGGKLMEYLAFDRPILAVMPPGEGRRLVEALPAGYAADVDPAAVAAALERLLDDSPAPRPADPAGRYDRLNLAGELAAVLDEVVRDAARAGRGGASGPEVVPDQRAPWPVRR
jgi:glycosyltransferase involved in cell wall biosynthesis